MSTDPPPNLPGIDPAARIYGFLGHCASLHRLVLVSLADHLRMSIEVAERFFSMDTTRMLLWKLAIVLEGRSLEPAQRVTWERWMYEVGDVVRRQGEFEELLVSGTEIELDDLALGELIERCGELGMTWLGLTDARFASRRPRRPGH